MSNATTARRFRDIPKGDFRVVRDCCSSGNCIECHDKTPFGVKLRVVQMDGIDEETAKECAHNWRGYNSAIEKMN